MVGGVSGRDFWGFVLVASSDRQSVYGVATRGLATLQQEGVPCVVFKKRGRLKGPLDCLDN
jgi:hypothetical protein